MYFVFTTTLHTTESVLLKINILPILIIVKIKNEKIDLRTLGVSRPKTISRSKFTALCFRISNFDF